MADYTLSTITLKQLTELIQDTCAIYQDRTPKNMDVALGETPLHEMFGEHCDWLCGIIETQVKDSQSKAIDFLINDFDNTVAELEDSHADLVLRQDIENFLLKSPLAMEIQLEQLYGDSHTISQNLFELMGRELSEEDKAFIDEQQKEKAPISAIEKMKTYKEYANLVVTATAAEMTEENKATLEKTELKTFLDTVQQFKDYREPSRFIDVEVVTIKKEATQKEPPQVEERVKISLDMLKTKVETPKVETPKITPEQELENRVNNFINKSLTKDEIAQANKRGMDVFDLMSIDGEPLSSEKWPTRMDKLKAMDKQLQEKECVDVFHVSKNGKKIEATRNYRVTPEDKEPEREKYSAFRLWLHDKGLFKINGFEDKMKRLSDSADFEKKTYERQKPVEQHIRGMIYTYEDKLNPITSFAKIRRNERDEKLDKQEEKEIQTRYNIRRDLDRNETPYEKWVRGPDVGTPEWSREKDDLKKARERFDLMEKDFAEYAKIHKGITLTDPVEFDKEFKKQKQQYHDEQDRKANANEKERMRQDAINKKMMKQADAINKKHLRMEEKEEEKEIKQRKARAEAKAKATAKAKAAEEKAAAKAKGKGM